MRRIKQLILAAAILLLIFVGWLALAPLPAGIPVLEYHMITETASPDEELYNVPPSDFREQMDYLRQEGYTTISMMDYAKARKGKIELPANPIILTFDDGYENNYTVLLPILEEYGLKATVYMVTNNIGRQGYLSWNQLRDMQERGIEIGSHTANHQPLTMLDPLKQEEEMKLSKLLLEWNGIHTVFSFSYPNGAFSADMPGMLERNDYLTAVTGDDGLNTLGTNPYLLQRINIPHPRLGLTEFKVRLLKARIMTRLGIHQH